MPTPKTRTQEYYEERALRRARSHFRDTEAFNKRMLREFNKSSKRLREELEKNIIRFGLQEGENNYTRQRIRSLMAGVNEILDDLYGKDGLTRPAEIQATIFDFLQDQYMDNFNRTTFNQFKGIGFGYDFLEPDVNAVKQTILEDFGGANFSDRLYEHKRRLGNTLRTELSNQFITGTSFQDTARIMADKLIIQYRNAVRLVRTESTTILNRSSIASYEELGLTGQYRYVATLDSRTSAICQSLDQMVFDVKDAQTGVNLPSMHPNCRSTTVPEFPDRERLGTRLARRSNGEVYEVPESLSYPEWQKRFVPFNP